MIRQIEKREIPARVKDAFRGGECYIEISPQRRKNGEARECEYIACADAVVRGDSIYLAIYKEKSAAGSLLTRSLWFGEHADVIVKGGEILRLKLIADRSHISGGIFTELLQKQRAEDAAADIGAVWEMSLVSFEALPALPEGEYTKEEMGLFEIHLDNPRIKKQEEKRNVTGCRFSLAPMSDDFIDIILSSIADVDTSKVWSSTDEFSTVYRGRRIHVLDALKACFIRSFRQGVHMTMNALITEGCPGDAQKDAALEDAVWAEDDTLANEPTIAEVHFPAAAKIELYPLGRADYMEQIEHVIEMAKDRGVFDRSEHYVTVVKGDVQELFGYFGAAAEYCGNNLEHYALEITVAVNFPEGE